MLISSHGVKDLADGILSMNINQTMGCNIIY